MTWSFTDCDDEFVLPRPPVTTREADSHLYKTSCSCPVSCCSAICCTGVHFVVLTYDTVLRRAANKGHPPVNAALSDLEVSAHQVSPDLSLT